MKKFAIAAVLALFLAPAAFAGAYVGASIGQTDTSLGTVSGNDSSWKIVGGYTFMKFVGVEGSYRNFGGLNETSGTTTLVSDASSLDVFGVAILPAGPVNLFAKAGYARIDFDATIDDPLFTNPISVSDSENELAYGLGLSFGIGKAHLRVEYEIFDTVEDMNMFSAGAVFQF